MTQMEEYLVVRLAQTMAGTKADCLVAPMIGSSAQKTDLALPTAARMVGSWAHMKAGTMADCLALVKADCLSTAVQRAVSSAQKKADC